MVFATSGPVGDPVGAQPEPDGHVGAFRVAGRQPRQAHPDGHVQPQPGREKPRGETVILLAPRPLPLVGVSIP